MNCISNRASKLHTFNGFVRTQVDRVEAARVDSPMLELLRKPPTAPTVREPHAFFSWPGTEHEGLNKPDAVMECPALESPSTEDARDWGHECSPRATR